MEIIAKVLLFSCALCYVSAQNHKFLDLGYGYDENTLVYPGGQKFGFTRQFAGEINGTFVASNDFQVGEHAGTHIDAPYHFNKNGIKVGEIPVEKLFGTGVYINATAETAGDYKYRLPASKFTDWEKENGPMPENSVIFVDFGWGERYPNFEKYFGPSKDNLQFPGISPEAVDWILNSKKVIGIGVDTPSPDAGGETFYAHVKLLGSGLYILENVNLNSDVIPNKFKVVIMPIKLMAGSGGPCRIIALYK